jgi:alkanesulfonate monooxygenase SsuD/methylene tetrahydromethanopterin reductase-like flavin-dependent oxidoreductase (luciferase family)
MPLRFGVLLIQERPVHELLGWATRFDEAGVDSLWVAEHLALPQNLDHPWYAGWDLLAAMAGVTADCRIGPLVTTFQYHSSLAMARHIVTVDALSEGRLDLGVGTGGAPVDRSFAGIPDASLGALAERLERGLTETRALLDGERLAVPPAPELVRPGPADIALNTPSPQLGKVPIIVGGHGSRSLDVAAKHANRWNTYGTRPGTEDVFEVLRRQSGQLSDRCVAIGRKPDDITRSVLLDFNPQLSPTSASELADVTRRLYELGFEECIAYAWLDGEVTRSTDELLSFVINTLPSLSAECN